MESDGDTRLPINIEVLKELELIALTLRVNGIDDLPYERYQQALTIEALINWLETYGLEAPFKLKLR